MFIESGLENHLYKDNRVNQKWKSGDIVDINPKGLLNNKSRH